ncbi:MAG: GlsB/YeaQ/YmgE family stress response membrane protein [Bryobacteraceae bacterium]
MHLLWFLIIGIAAGWLAGHVVRGGGYGLIGDLVVGVIGAFIGGWLLGGALRLFAGGLIGSLVTATIGAIVLLYVIRLIKKA